MRNLELTSKEIFLKNHNIATFDLPLNEDEIKLAKEKLAKVGLKEIRLNNLSSCLNSDGKKMYRYITVRRAGRPRIEKGLI